MSQAANKGQVANGSIVYPDDNFSCMQMNIRKAVFYCDDGLYIKCSHGKHFLDGQLNINNEYVGLSLTKW